MFRLPQPSKFTKHNADMTPLQGGQNQIAFTSLSHKNESQGKGHLTPFLGENRAQKLDF